ncbi:unnamed protein product, partial [Didymodactylos carnosus]
MAQFFHSYPKYHGNNFTRYTNEYEMQKQCTQYINEQLKQQRNKCSHVTSYSLSSELKLPVPFQTITSIHKTLSSSYLTKSTDTSLPIGLLSHSDSLNNHKHFQLFSNHVQTAQVASNDNIYFHVIPSASTLAGTIVPLPPSSSTPTATTTLTTYNTFDQQSSRTMACFHKNLGRNGLRVSQFGLGTWVTFGGQISDDAAEELITTAYENGINLFDTAEVYAAGKAEITLGKVLKKKKWRRSSYIVCTKLYWGGKAETEKGLSRKHIIEGLRASLERLQLEYVDIVFANKPDPTVPMEEIVRSFTQVINMNMTFYWGTSRWSPMEIMEAYSVARQFNLIPPICEQAEYHLFQRDKVEVHLPEIFSKIGIGTMTWSPLACGLLSGKYDDGVPLHSRAALKGYGWLKDKILNEEGRKQQEKLRELALIASKLDCTLAQLAIAWCLKNENVHCVLLGVSSVEQLYENLNSIQRLSNIVMRCHYDVLGVTETANNAELTKAYRKLALQWHPDKNLDQIQEAKKRFLEIQAAYEVLTDPRERAWYDQHRDVMLKRGDGGDYQDDVINIYPFFTASCYQGYNDSENGFYTVYDNLFKRITEQDLSSNSTDKVIDIPCFGKSDSDYEQAIGPFYAYWTNYCTLRSYVWVEEHDTRDATDRRVRRLMEQENKKARDKAKKERNDEIR